MPAQKGRSFLLQVDMTGGGSYSTVGGFRENGYSLKAGGVDATTKDSLGWQERLAGAGVSALTITASGLFENDAALKKVRGYAIANSLNSYKLLFDNGETVTGSFEVTGFEMSGSYNDTQQYQLTLESSGVPTFA